MKQNEIEFNKNIKTISTKKLSHEEFTKECLNSSKSLITHPYNNKLSSFYKYPNLYNYLILRIKTFEGQIMPVRNISQLKKIKIDKSNLIKLN